MDWHKATMLTGVLLMQCVWVLALDDGTLVDSDTLVPTR